MGNAQQVEELCLLYSVSFVSFNQSVLNQIFGRIVYISLVRMYIEIKTRFFATTRCSARLVCNIAYLLKQTTLMIPNYNNETAKAKTDLVYIFLCLELKCCYYVIAVIVVSLRRFGSGATLHQNKS